MEAMIESQYHHFMPNKLMNIDHNHQWQLKLLSESPMVSFIIVDQAYNSKPTARLNLTKKGKNRHYVSPNGTTLPPYKIVMP
jgi:hypothetical protein